MSVRVRNAIESDRGWMAAALSKGWGSPVVVSRGRLHDADRLPALVAERGERRLGLLTYRVSGDELEVVTLQAFEPRTGVGSALLQAARATACRMGCRRLWLVTTNDNTPAQSFYRALGMALVTVHRGAVTESRRLKPGIPQLGVGGCPIEDELEYAFDPDG